MAFLIGTDEAGYGPNLGPLTVTGTLWEVPSVETDLYLPLEKVVSRTPIRSAVARKKLHIADSKQVYRSAGTIESLERSVLSLLLAAFDKVPADIPQLLTCILSECVEHRMALLAGEADLWQSANEFELPCVAKSSDIEVLGRSFAACCESATVGLKDVRCQPVFPAAFNRGVLEAGNKATLLSSVTLKIVRHLLNQTQGRVTIVCDKHGGRSRYLELIQKHLTNEPVTIEQESRGISSYFWREPDRDVSIRFVAKGESFLPTAVASMFSKYVREIYMDVWNEFWQSHQPDVKSTKGYPQDAKRFMADIQATRRRLKIPTNLVWRSR